MEETTEVVVVINPLNDERFSAAVDEAAREALTAAGLELALMPAYPDLRVVEGGTQGASSRWYAYRDGRWISPFESH